MFCYNEELHYICSRKKIAKMEAKESLVKLIKALIEIASPIQKQILIDFLLGKESRSIIEYKLEELETFGIGDAHDDEYWINIIDAAFEQGYIKTKPTKSNDYITTPAGKKFVKKPTSFIIEDEEDFKGITPEGGIDELVKEALVEKVGSETKASPKTKQQIKLIRAIDRKMALDDFAESESLGLDDVLTDVENFVQQGRLLDITYFTNEVLGEDCVNELVEYFKESKTDDLDKAMQEYGDVYNIEEIRLARIVYRVQQIKK